MKKHIKTKAKIMGFYALVLAALFLLAGCGNNNAPPNDNEVVGETVPAITQPTQPTLPIPPSDSTEQTLEQLRANSFNATFSFIEYGAPEYRRRFGTGFFISPTGLAVTAHHVVVGQSRLTVELDDGRVFNVSGYYSYDFGNDLAVIQVDLAGDSVAYMAIADTPAQVFDTVFAIGSPGLVVDNVIIAVDPLTVTDGIISRIAREPIGFSGYVISGMLQTTARIHGGNSGGPLINSRGQVVGVNVAGGIVRVIDNLAVPAYRINLTNTVTGQYRPLPILPPVAVRQIVYSIPFVPTFGSVSTSAEFIFGGPVLYLTDAAAIIDRYDYIYAYRIDMNQFINEGDAQLYVLALVNAGFQVQGDEVIDEDGRFWMLFLYHTEQDVSLLLHYRTADSILQVLLGRGNAHGGSGTLLPEPPSQTDGTQTFQGYELFPSVPDFGAMASHAEQIGVGFARDFGIADVWGVRDRIYITSSDFISIYRLQSQFFEQDKERFISHMRESGFSWLWTEFYEELNASATFFMNMSNFDTVTFFYYFDSEELWIAMGSTGL